MRQRVEIGQPSHPQRESHRLPTVNNTLWNTPYTAAISGGSHDVDYSGVFREYLAHHPEAKLVVFTDEGFKEQHFIDMRSAEERGDVLIKKDVDFEFYHAAVQGPLMEQWLHVRGKLLILLAKLFVERESATMPVAVVSEDTAA